jgi:hypothetical protein
MRERSAVTTGLSRRAMLYSPLALALAGCLQTIRSGGTTVDELGIPAIALGLARVDLVDNYVSPRQSPYIDYQLAVPPSQAIRDWLKTRIISVGGPGVGHLTIEKASLQEVPYPITGPFGWGSTFKLTLDLAVQLTVTGDPQIGAGAFARADVQRQSILQDGAGPLERSEGQADIIRAGIIDLDQQLQRSIRQYLAAIVRN